MTNNNDPLHASHRVVDDLERARQRERMLVDTSAFLTLHTQRENGFGAEHKQPEAIDLQTDEVTGSNSGTKRYERPMVVLAAGKFIDFLVWLVAGV